MATSEKDTSEIESRIIDKTKTLFYSESIWQPIEIYTQQNHDQTKRVYCAYDLNLTGCLYLRVRNPSVNSLTGVKVTVVGSS